MEENMNDILSKAYHDPKIPGSFSSEEKFYNEMKKKIKGLKKIDVVNFLLSENSHTLFKNVKKKFQRRKIIKKFPGETYAIDLIDIAALKSYNGQMSWIITCLCIFSNFLFTEPSKKKNKEEMTISMTRLLEKIPIGKRKNAKFFCDRGQEFLSIKDYLKNKYNIEIYHVDTHLKASPVERVNRTLMTKIYRILNYQNNYDWLPILDSVTESINNTPQPTALGGFSPKEAFYDDDVIKKIKKMNAMKLVKMNKEYAKIRPKFQIGQKVRYLLKKGIFEKGFAQTFSSTIHKVIAIKLTTPWTYLISGSQKSWYGNELIRAEPIFEKDDQIDKNGKNGKDDKKGFYIDDTKLVSGKTTRSGKILSEAKEYLLKNTQSPDYSEWISQETHDRMIKNGKLPAE